ncbi:DUF4238 domain-containing protein [Sporocytophaga myxococcoides]|uniref:DUF4238 domain-containing protein n=1 Tax=Sporocytophaga myxococcoides TaxID=153721 RepID=UPI00042A0807|nr:DUF4238 domain-containing protein [Sporocytophaga myxococcoides]
MSLPRNHHYVSQCQIKNFFNQKEGKIYLYDKETNNFFHKTTTKTVFSETDANSKFENGLIDHGSLEIDLKRNFEDDFTFCINEIHDAVVKNNQVFTQKLYQSLIILTKYGIIGEIRHPKFKAQSDQIIGNIFKEIASHATPELKKQFKDLDNLMSQTKYSNNVIYSEFADEVLSKMGEIFFHIYYIQDEGLFILPDRSSYSHRAKINEYFNPDVREIAIVDIPLSSKIFLHAKSKKMQDGSDKIILLTRQNKDFIDKVNISVLQIANKQVACESGEYLKELVKLL